MGPFKVDINNRYRLSQDRRAVVRIIRALRSAPKLSTEGPMALLASLSRRCARPLQTLLVMPQALPAVQAAAVVHRGGRNRPLFGSLPSSTSSSCIGAVAGFASNSKWGPMNEDISANVVQLVANDGKLQPNVPFKRALREAQDQGMDLVQVSANGQQVICRIFDARKRMFAMKKSTKAAKPKQDKEVVFGVKIEVRGLLIIAMMMRICAPWLSAMCSY